MAYVPPTRVASGAATGTRGEQIQTAKVANNIVGDKELEITLTAGETAVTNFRIFNGAWRKSSERALATGLTFSSPGFAAFDNLTDFFRSICTNIYGLRIETTDVANFQSNIVFTEKDPTGKETSVTKSLSKYRVPVGTGYSETIELSEKDINIILWEGLEMTFSKLKESTSITLYFKVRGWNKVQELNALQSDIIA